MNEKKTNETILTFYGLEFDHFTKLNNPIYRAFFIDEHFIFYELYTSRAVYVPMFLCNCANGTRLNVAWKFYGRNLKKVICDVSFVEKGE